MKLFHEIKNLVFNLQGKQIHHSLCSTSANSLVNDGFTAVLKKLQLMANKPFILQASWLKSTCTILYPRKRTIKNDGGRILWCPILMFSLFSFLSMPIEMWAGSFVPFSTKLNCLFRLAAVTLLLTREVVGANDDHTEGCFWLTSQPEPPSLVTNCSSYAGQVS